MLVLQPVKTLLFVDGLIVFKLLNYHKWVVHTKTHRDDNIGGCHNVNGQAPEMHEPNHIDQVEDDKQED